MKIGSVPHETARKHERTVELEERCENQPINNRMQESTRDLTSTNKEKKPKQRTTTSWLKIKKGTQTNK
jgi:hypothetical protein